MAGMGNTKHFETGSTRPGPPGKDVLRVYGMKFCPYVQRLKLVLAAKNVKHETVNINLSNKPEWYFEINPGGKVPSLEINGDILFESDLTALYVDETYPGKRLVTQSPVRKAKESMVLSQFGTATQGFYRFAYSANDDTEAKTQGREKLNAGLEKLEEYFKKSGYPFICGDESGFTDYMVWLHLERMLVFLKDEVEKYPLITAYSARMSKDSAVIACRHSDQLHRDFVQGINDKKPKFDIGTVDQ
eukprot:TRINITY_DN14479_c0_g1_i1.p1 TRINITY_DN14479_c0_g1~~TRINITY_DN14479_c0_g1_i1.p1  ORF type:complete len:245 (-),score=-4.79 TRINITY_DN14479_c0_g1_i1:215-949(-)